MKYMRADIGYLVFPIKGYIFEHISYISYKTK